MAGAPRIGGGQGEGVVTVNITRSLVTPLAAFALLVGCSQDLILEGERLDLRALSEVQDPPEADNRSAPISLPAMVAHSDWTHRNGSPTHAITHPALGSSLTPVWSARIGEGDGRRHRISAEPVVAGDRIFTLDSRATVSATSTEGATLWQRDITPPYARRDDASGGGLAFGAGRLFVTSAFGLLVAFDPATGEELWRQRFDAPVTAAPTVAGDRVHVVSSDSALWQIDVRTGRVLWQSAGIPPVAMMVGGAAPAVTDRLALYPTPAGDLTAVLRDSGIEIWSNRIAGQRITDAQSRVTDITGDPVVVGNVVYVGNQTGRVVALDLDTGQQRWSARDGAYGPVWPVGGSLFHLSDHNTLVRLDAATGERIWSVALPGWRDLRERRRAEIFAHYGPVLAGGRLIVASNDGLIRSFDPVSGEVLASVEVPRGASSAPVVAGRTLYVVSSDGLLHAYR